MRNGKLQIPLVPFENVNEYTITALHAQNIFEFTFLEIEEQNDATITLQADNSVFRDEFFERHDNTISFNLLHVTNRSFWVLTPSVQVTVTSTSATLHMWLTVHINAYTHFLGCESEQIFSCVPCPSYTFKDWDGSGNCVTCPSQSLNV